VRPQRVPDQPADFRLHMRTSVRHQDASARHSVLASDETDERRAAILRGIASGEAELATLHAALAVERQLVVERVGASGADPR
jgi:hypothetical protein